MPNLWISSKATLPSAWRDRCRPYNSCVLPAMTYGAEDTHKTSTEQTCGRTDTIERSMLNITYSDRHTNKWAREGTKVVGRPIIGSVRKMKWSWAGHINRLKDDRWTSRVTTWRPYGKGRRQGRLARRWTNTGEARFGSGQRQTG